MDYKEFSSKVKSKYPGVYDDLDDETLARKMVAKFPQYSDVSFEEESPSPSLSPTAQYSEPRGRMAKAEDIERSLPVLGGIGLAALAGPEILLGAGLAGAGALAGKSAAMLSRAARTGESEDDNTIKGALTSGGRALVSGVKEGGGALLGGGIVKGLSKAASFGGQRFAKPIYRFLVGKFKGVNRNVVENVFEAAEDVSPTVAEAGKDFIEKVAGISRTAKAAEKATEQAGEEAVARAGRASLGPQEKALEAARAMKTPGLEPQAVAESAASFSDKFNDGISSMYDKAISKASKTRMIPVEDLFNAANDLERSFMVGDVAVGKQSRDAVAAIQEWREALVGVAGPTGMGIPEDRALDLIRKLGKNTSWDGVSSKEAVSALRTLRGKWREAFGKSNPKLGADLRKIAEKINAKEAFDDAFGLTYKPGFGTSPSDQTFTAVESVVKGKRPVSAAAGRAIPGFSEGLESATRRTAAEAQKEAAIESSEAALKGASSLRDAGVREAERSAAKANQAARSFAAQKRPDLLDLRRAAEAAATAGRGSPQEQALLEILEPYLGKGASGAANNIIMSASQEIYGRKPAASIIGRVGGTALSPQAEKLIEAISKRILSGAQRGAAPVGAAIGAATDE